MEYYGKQLCISARELVEGGIMTVPSYKQMAARGLINVMRRGHRGGCALIAVQSLPTVYRKKVKQTYGKGDEVLLRGWVMSNYELDQNAVAYFTDWAAAHHSDHATTELAMKYAVNASVLNCCIRLFDNARMRKKIMGETYEWNQMTDAIETLRDELHHDLPASTLRFRKKVSDYRKHGYASLISTKFGTQNARKVDFKTERLIMSIARQENKPFNTNVREMYIQFVCGELDIYDPDTGELLNPNDFTDKNGDPKELSESTIANVLNKPNNKLLLHAAHDSFTAFLHEQMPHMHRHGGDFSLSQITMDDVDLTRKLKDTKLRVHAYYAYDVVSQCVIGAAYARKKDQMLVVECFRDMFRLIDRHGWGIPAGIEVENHLMSEYKEGFLQAGVAFSFVRFCAPQNSQEKYAEQMNGAKKRSIIHKNHAGIGRFYGKGKWRMESQKISDETNDTWEDNKYYTFEELVADDRADNYEWNHALHPDQKKFRGMTRWDVLVGRVNPSLKPMNHCTLARYIGEHVDTSIRRNSTVRVCYTDWWLSSPEVLERLQPNNMKVTAYYLPDENGKPTDVYLFQGERFIDKVDKVHTYNRVMAEQTPDDDARFIEQRKKVATFQKYVRDNAIPKVGITPRHTTPNEPPPPLHVAPLPPITNEPPTTYCVNDPLESL